MSQYTRRTHVVRVYAKNPDGTKNKNRYFDVEVLDAISFRTNRGEEMVLVTPADKAATYIKDDTGQGLDQSPGRPARRAHVKQVKGTNNTSLYVEVLDAVAFRDKRGEEWIITMPNPAPYDATDGSGGGGATRRTHDEKISGATPPKPNPTSKYITVQRCDNVAFRSVRGQEMIVSMPSYDDGNGTRASTYITSPQGYDPTDDKMTVPENKDQDFYVQFDKNKSPLVEKEKIAQGFLWWIRKVKNGGNPAVMISASANQIGPGPVAINPTVTISGPQDDNGNDLTTTSDEVFTYSRMDGSTVQNSVYAAWPGFLAPPTPDNYLNSVSVQPQVAPFAVYGGEFFWNGTFAPGNPVPTPSSGGGNGLFPDLAGCQDFCDAFNRLYGDGLHFYARYWNSDNVVVESGGASILTPVQILLDPIVTAGSAGVNVQTVVQLPASMKVGDSIAISVDCGGNGRTSCGAVGYVGGVDSVDDATNNVTADPVEEPPDVPGGSAFKGPTNYTVTATMVATGDDANPTRISIVVSGGDHGGGPAR